jgi:hypothetical protein
MSLAVRPTAASEVASSSHAIWVQAQISPRPNPSLSPRPATAGHLARAVRWFMLHRTGKPSCLRGRG